MCVTDYAIAVEGASLRLPETSLGIPPAQIAPFIVRRVGLTQARRLAITGGRLDAAQATALGITHEHVADEAALQDALSNILGQIRRCAPQAVATTKQLMRAAVTDSLSAVLDAGATAFGEAARGPEGVEGMTAFIEKRKPRWAGA